MLKIKFLEILDEISAREYLNEEERIHIQTIKENAEQLPEKISTDILIEKLGLITIKGVTSEDGYFKEFINTKNNENLESQTEIYYLLKGQQVSCWHALGTTETWTWLGGKEISILILNDQPSIEPIEIITLNKDHRQHTIEKDTKFAAKIKDLINDNDFAMVTCLCKPGFDKEKHYKELSSKKINYLCKMYPNYCEVIREFASKNNENLCEIHSSNSKVIEEVTPKNNKTFVQSLIQFFTCCIGVKKNEEEAPLINTSQNSR